MSEAAKHMPGEWIVDYAGNDQIIIIDTTSLSRHIAYMPFDSMPEEEIEANANLIVSANDLLEALEDLVKCVHEDGTVWARRIIAKARGQYHEC